MALGAMMISMPAALLGSYVLSVQNGFNAVQSLAAYSLFGTVFLLSILLVNGVVRQ